MISPLAEIRTYDDLHQALRARADHIGVTRLGLDEITGLTSGHSGKLLAPTKIKRLGPISFDLMLPALGLKLLLVEDAEIVAKMQLRWAEFTKASRAA